MNNLLLGFGGFAAGAGVIVAIGLSATPSSITTPEGSPMTATSPMTARSGMEAQTATGSAGAELRIAHVLRGCHVWNSGQRRAATMRLSLPRGGRLTILDQDLDPHQLVELSGPRLRMPGPMAMMGKARVRFAQAGTYRLATKTVELPGQAMPEAKTIGPDNRLKLVVTVT